MDNTLPIPLSRDAHEIGFLLGIVILMIVVMLGFFLLQVSIYNLESPRSTSQEEVPLTQLERVG